MAVTIKQALKKVYKSLSGGKNTKKNTISGIIDDISTVSSPGGSDPNDVIFVVKVLTGSPPTNPSATFEEMLNAMNSGKLLVLKYLNIPEEYGNQFDCYHFYSYYDYGQSSSTGISFAYIKNKTQHVIKCNINDEWTITSTDLSGSGK